MDFLQLYSIFYMAEDLGSGGANDKTDDKTDDYDYKSEITKLNEKIAALTESKKEVKKDIENSGSQREKDINIAKIQDLEKTIEDMREAQGAQAQLIVDSTMQKIELQELTRDILPDKKEALEDALRGKTNQEKIDYINKYKVELLVPSSRYSGGGVSAKDASSKTSDLDKMMDDVFIQESGLTREEVEAYMTEDSVIAFEKTLMRQLKNIKNPSTLHNFFKEGAK